MIMFAALPVLMLQVSVYQYKLDFKCRREYRLYELIVKLCRESCNFEQY